MASWVAMSTPLVGLTTYREQAAYGGWHQRTDLLPAEYADAVTAVGGVPVLLPPSASDAPTADAPTDAATRVGTHAANHAANQAANQAAAAAVVARLDALVVSGGADVDPGAYGAEPHLRTTGTRPGRDAWEFALLDAAERAGLPVLGVCRGMQLMAVHAGGRLEQHLPDVLGHHGHSPDGATYLPNAVITLPGTRLATLVGERLEVSCHHHQAVADEPDAHPGFVVAARAVDGTPEAMETPGDRFCVAVQWHPETAVDVGLLAGLIAATLTPRR